MSDTTDQAIVNSREFSALKQDITDMKSLMSRMVEAMSRITVIEERQHTMAQSTSKAIERMEAITERQHAYELTNAESASTAGRVGRLELVFQELNVENERNKARFQTVVWTVRALWAVIGSSAIGAVIWITQMLARIPAPL